MPVRLVLLALLLVSCCRAQAPDNGITPAELTQAPTPARISFLVTRAQTAGWAGVAPILREAAVAAYETRSDYAGGWYYLYRWAALLGTPQSQALPQWIDAIRHEKVGHANMPAQYQQQPGALAAYCSPAFQYFALGSPAFSEEFFLTLAPVDNPMAVLSILQELYVADPARFADYQNLAIAIAVVYDVPPPPDWPHGQVNAGALPRRLPAPGAAFAYWTRLDRSRLTLQRLRRLPASELKFLVDEVAPFAELDWARRNIGPGLADLAKAYDLVRYRKDRQAQNAFMWMLPDYRLPTILSAGGICVDQAYFAATVGKAKGIPTILFRGAGLDGRHAWFGYLDGNERWQNDCGRYAEQKYVVGLAFDPQTWGNINDHELLFLSERFRALPTYKLSVLDAQFAAEYLADSKYHEAMRAAREAVNRERRNLDGWHILLQAQLASAPADRRAREGVIREAIAAFQRYPDLEVAFTRELVASLRARGEASVADFEEQSVVRRYQAGRVDLSIQEAADIMERSLRDDQVPDQIQVYQRVLDIYGRGAGIDFYDKVVQPYATHLQAEQQTPAALAGVDRARQYLRIEKGSQLEVEINALTDRLKAGNH